MNAFLKLTFRSILMGAAPVILTAQIALGGGSIYSRYGIGDLIYFGSNRTDAMGGAGIGLLGDGFINRLNPAGLARISRTRISGAFEYTNYLSSDASQSGRFGRGAFKALAFAIPVSAADGIVFQMESTPYSSVQYSTEVSDATLKQSFFGTGGLSTLGVGSSYSPTRGFFVGAKFNYVFGRIRQIVRYTFLGDNFINGEIHHSQFYSGFNLTLGVTQDSVGHLIGSSLLRPLTLGFVLSTPTRLSVDGDHQLISGQSSDIISTSSGTVDLPLAAGLGLSYVTAERYVLTADVYHQQWKNANFFGKSSVDLRNSTRFGGGFEALPDRSSDSYFQKVAYRAGISYHSTYYNIKGQSVDEWYVTGGFGLPIGPDARLNVGLQAGVRGSTSSGLQRDTIFRFSLSLSASEAWFIKFEED